MTDNQQSFTLLDPYGVPIMKGNMNAIMEHIPDSVARNRALDDMVRIACDAVEAEERAAEARAAAVKHLCDGISRFATRLDQFEKARSLAAKRAEAARKEAAQRQVKRYMDELPDPDAPEPYSIDPAERAASIRDGTELPPPKDPTGASLENDDGDLEVKSAVDPERYGSDEYPGDLPNELKKEAPAPSGSYTEPDPDPREPKDPKQVQQPISASLW
jgi:hypothetical protein